MGVGQGLGAIRRLLRLGMCKGVGGGWGFLFFLSFCLGNSGMLDTSGDIWQWDFLGQGN